MANALKFKQANVPRQPNELARFKVVAGPDFGAVFVIINRQVSIGRGEENDLVILDLKASRVHAQIFAGSTGWEIRDLGSANGITYNGKQVRSAQLKLKDTVAIGETVLEFMTFEAATQVLMGPPRSLSQVQADQANRTNLQPWAVVGGMAASLPPSAGASKSKSVNPKVLLLVVLGIGSLFFFDTNEPKPKKPKSKGEPNRDLAAYLPTSDPPVVKKSVDLFFKSGFREFNQGNYLRAKTQFETVLQMSPGHPLATLYLENCDKQIEDEVKFHLEYGKKSYTAGKLKEARGHFEAILRLLFKDQSNPAFLEAKDQLEKLAKEGQDPLTPSDAAKETGVSS